MHTLKKQRASGSPDFTKGVIVMSHSSSKQIPLAYSLLSAGAAVALDGDGYALLDINKLITKDRDGVILAFVITGDSMRDDIKPGYIAFVDTTLEPRSGDTVAVSINNETCIKIFERERQRLFLVPKNGDYQPREVWPTDDLYILGVVTYHLAVY